MGRPFSDLAAAEHGQVRASKTLASCKSCCALGRARCRTAAMSSTPGAWWLPAPG